MSPLRDIPLSDCVRCPSQPRKSNVTGATARAAASDRSIATFVIANRDASAVTDANARAEWQPAMCCRHCRTIYSFSIGCGTSAITIASAVDACHLCMRNTYKPERHSAIPTKQTDNFTGVLRAATVIFYLTNKHCRRNSAKASTGSPSPTIHVELFKRIASWERGCQIDVPKTSIKVSYNAI